MGWFTLEEFAGSLAQITACELQYWVGVPGFRVRVITLGTTLFDPLIYPKAELAERYRRQRKIELNIRHITIAKEMDILDSKTVDGVGSSPGELSRCVTVVNTSDTAS